MKRSAEKYLVYSSRLTIRLADAEGCFLSSLSFLSTCGANSRAGVCLPELVPN